MLYGALAYVSQSGFSYIEAQLSYISRFSNDGCTDRWPWNWAFTRSEAGPSDSSGSMQWRPHVLVHLILVNAHLHGHLSEQCDLLYIPFEAELHSFA